jgi:hypothetical protein
MPVTPGALRRSLALVVAASLLAIPAAVSADRPFEYSDRSVGFDCFIEDESTITFTGAWSAEEWGANAWLQIIDTTFEDPEADPTILYGFTDDVTVTDDGTNVTFNATIPLFEPGSDPEEPGAPAGEAVLQATLVPDGPPQTLTSERQGNRQIRATGTIQPMAVSGTLTLPGDEVITLSGDQCFGQRSDYEVWETNPRAFVDHRSGIFASCFWETDTGFAAFYAESGEFGTFADALLLEFEPGADEPSGGLVPDYGATMSVTFTTSQLSATVPLLTYPDGDPAGSATATATVTTGEPETFTIISQGFRSRIKGTPLTLDGTLVFPTGETFSFADGGCFAVDFRESFKTNPAQGPKPGGKAPANDDPSGAIALRPGSRLNVQTGGAAWEPEVEASCAPIGTTLWYTIQGTGGPITVDTAGSGFDTVAAVYTSEGSAWEEVACVDDVPVGTIGFSYQSAVTWDSVAGQTYYVQLGGYFGEFGRLRVAVY